MLVNPKAREVQYHEQQEGWQHEWLPDRWCLCFMRPREVGGGFVTVDFERRIFSTGYGKPREHAGDVQYTGRGWADRLARDAVDYLEGVMTEHSSTAR